jgi:hypothetical protein
MTPDEIGFLVGADATTVRQLGTFEIPDDMELSAVQAMAERLKHITAHDRMRLAAFRAGVSD